MNGRREYGLALVACAIGAGLLFLAASQHWVTLTVPRDKPFPPLRRTISGSHAQPLLTGLAIVGLGGVVALLATRRIGRRIVGALLLIVAVVGVIWLARDLHGMSASRAQSLLTDAGPVVGVPAGANAHVQLHLAIVAVGLLGAVLLGLTGALAVVRGGVWPAMGSRYDRPSKKARQADSESPADGTNPPAERRGTGQRSLWEALDRGEDPTATEESRSTR
jgi:uncharacterized membrane protein (TIGR02234 family)